MEENQSPCVRNCCLDDKDICIGCHRSLNEILQWGRSDTSLASKKEILANCEKRKQTRRISMPTTLK